MKFNEAFVDLEEFMKEIVSFAGMPPSRLQVRGRSEFGRQTDPKESLFLKYPMGIVKGEYVNIYDRFDQATSTCDNHDEVVRVLAQYSMTRGEYEWLSEHPDYKIFLSVGRSQFVVLDIARAPVQLFTIPIFSPGDGIVSYIMIIYFVTHKHLFKHEEHALLMGNCYPSQVIDSSNYISEQIQNGDQVIVLTRGPVL